MTSGCVHIGGEFVELDDAKMSIFDTGFLHSDVVYDVTTSWKGYIFKLDEHLERFTASCTGFRLTNPYSKDETARLLAECVRPYGAGRRQLHPHARHTRPVSRRHARSAAVR